MNETLKRIISGVLIALIYAAFFHFGWYSYFPLFIFICGVSFIVLDEFYMLFLNKETDKVIICTGKIFAIVIAFLFYLFSLQSYQQYSAIEPEFLQSVVSFFEDRQYILGGVLILLLIILGLYNIVNAKLSGGLHSMSIITFGILYIPLTISFIFMLRGLKFGVFYIWFVSLITVMTDVWGYFTGKFLGKHKLNWPVSPNKTWEGYVGAFLMQLIISFGFYQVVSIYVETPVWSNFDLIFISVLIFATSVFGDLFESFIKRNAHAKDSGHFLPGHGGLLDRIDSIMFSLPVFYFYITFLNK